MIAWLAKFRLSVTRAAAALFVLSAFPVGDACAQDLFSDLFGGLFDGGRPGVRRPARAPRYPRYHPSYPRYYQRYPREISEPRRAPSGAEHSQRVQKSERREQVERAEPSLEKAPGEAVFFTAVVGDALALLLGDGLDEAFEDTPQIGVLHKGKENSGLVRKDYYDWLKAAQEIANAEKRPQMVTIMIGTNDRQALVDNGRSLEPFSPRWREIYAARVDALIQIFKDKDIPVVWVGLPVMKNERYSADMAQLNDIYRAGAAKAGIPFVDLWDIFADDHGRYGAYGPDVNGQNVKLRSVDGVHFTEAGARKLAHFVEGEVKRLFEARQQPADEQKDAPLPHSPEAPLEPASASSSPAPAPVVFRATEVEAPPAAPRLPEDRPAIGPVQPLTGAATADETLARREKRKSADKANSPARAVAEHVFVDGGAQPARPGRADDFSWPAKPATEDP